jgi:hypothetical protein
MVDAEEVFALKADPASDHGRRQGEYTGRLVLCGFVDGEG